MALFSNTTVLPGAYCDKASLNVYEGSLGLSNVKRLSQACLGAWLNETTAIGIVAFGVILLVAKN